MTPSEFQKMLDDMLAMGIAHLDSAVVEMARAVYLAAGDDPVAFKDAEEQHAAILRWRELKLAELGAMQARARGQLH
jgi:hypothetical protein